MLSLFVKFRHQNYRKQKGESEHSAFETIAMNSINGT